MVYQIEPVADSRYIAEFRASPIGAHSPGLQRLLNIMRLDAGRPTEILICRRHFTEYVIGHMPADRSLSIEIENEPVFASREAAEWEVFQRRWRTHTGRPGADAGGINTSAVGNVDQAS